MQAICFKWRNKTHNEISPHTPYPVFIHISPGANGARPRHSKRGNKRGNKRGSKRQRRYATIRPDCRIRSRSHECLSRTDQKS